MSLFALFQGIRLFYVLDLGRDTEETVLSTSLAWW